MKLTKITLSLALFGALTLAMADNTPTSVDSQIAAIQVAPAKERVQMMNKFKQRLANMNQQERMNTITKMQEKLHPKAASGSTTHEQAYNTKDKSVEMGEMMKERTQKMAQEKQMQANEQMSHMQNMNQMQEANHFMHMNENDSMNDGSNANWTGGSMNDGSNANWTGDSNYKMNMEH